MMMLTHGVGQAAEHIEKHLITVRKTLGKGLALETTLVERAGVLAELADEFGIIQADVNRAMMALGEFAAGLGDDHESR